MYDLVVLGAGVMGTAVVSAILANASEKPSSIVLVTKSEASAARLAKQFPMATATNKHDEKRKAIAKAHIVILACKPYQVHEFDLDLSLFNGVVISLCAGVTLSQLPGSAKAKIMTNTPAKFGCGMATVAFSGVSESDRARTMDIAGSVGEAVEIPEKNMDAATALVGSGPAFCLLMMEALYDGGVRMGLPHDAARLAAAKVMEGTAKMVLETKEHPAVLKSQVCTPGGTTIGGLLKLEDAGVRGAIARAVEEAANISASFAK